MATFSIKITDIPVKVLMNNILPFCEAKDLLSLGRTDWFFAVAVAGEWSWRRKLWGGDNFIGSEMIRTSSRKPISQRFRNARVSIWGCVTFHFVMLRGVNLFVSARPIETSGTAQSIKDAKNAAYKLVRGVVIRQQARQSTTLIETCAEMCRTEGVNFAEVLQDPVFEGHSALYCVGLGGPHPNQYSLLSTILNHSGPLSSKTINEVDDACVTFRDQATFSRFWRHPAYHAISGTDGLSLGGTSPADHAEVHDSSGCAGSLVVRFEITQFHKRMSTSGSIVLKFVAKSSSTC